jgi:glucose 1-dehydrogenase
MDKEQARAYRRAFRLAGQVAIITGAATGLGRASAIALGGAGVKIVINHLPGSEPDAESVKREIEALEGTAITIAADVSDERQVEAMVDETVRRFGTLHILINNAGLQRGAKFEDMTLEQWRLVIDVNLTGQFLCARAAIRRFLQRGMQLGVSTALGKIVCMSSVHQTIPWAFEANYAASKGGVSLLMQSLAQEFAPQRIRVNAIAPGAVRTPINRAAWETESAAAQLLSLIPYGRIGEPVDIGHAVLWLASDFSDYMTGATLFIDGGMSLYPSFRGGG